MSSMLLYQILFLTSIATNVVIAVIHVFAPACFAKLVGLEWRDEMRGFARAWGSTLLGLHLVYLPSLIDPIGYAWITWSSIVIKCVIMPSTFWTNPPGFRLFGIWDCSWGLALLTAYSWLLLSGVATVGR